MNKKIFLASVIGIIALIAFPMLIPNPYYIHLAETILIYSILLFGLDIVVGYTGQVSLGHAGLFGIGAYITGVLVFKLDVPWPLAMLGSIGGAALFGAILALPALRVTGPYLAMVTLAFGTIIQILINEMTFITEGPLGIKISKPVIFGTKLTEVGYFYLVAGLMVISLIVVHRILKSNLGRAFEALRDSPIASDCMGVSVYRYKVYAFVISAGLAGLAGSLFAYSEEYISPQTFNFELTILFLLAVIMGGRKTRSGALIGALIVVMLPSLLADIDLFRKIASFFAVVAVASAAVALLFIGLGLLLAPAGESPVGTGLPSSWAVVILVCGLAGLRLAWRLQGGDASGARAWCLLMALLSLPTLPYSLPVALPALFGAWRLWGGVR